jgi:hypothetical protein
VNENQHPHPSLSLDYEGEGNSFVLAPAAEFLSFYAVFGEGKPLPSFAHEKYFRVSLAHSDGRG